MSWFMKQRNNEKKTHKKQNSDQGSNALNANLSLPPNFADDLLDLELEVEQPNVSIEVITRLIELYGVTSSLILIL